MPKWLQEKCIPLEKSGVYLHDKPLTVISAGLYTNREEGLVWKELQTKLLLKSNRVRVCSQTHQTSEHISHHACINHCFSST